MAKVRNKFAEALIARGEREVPSRSGRYRTFTRNVISPGGAKTFYFLGRAGALRFGRCASESYPVSDSFKRALLRFGMPRLATADCGSRYGMPVAAGMLKR